MVLNHENAWKLRKNCSKVNAKVKPSCVAMQLIALCGIKFWACVETRISRYEFKLARLCFYAILVKKIQIEKLFSCENVGVHDQPNLN